MANVPPEVEAEFAADLEREAEGWLAAALKEYGRDVAEASDWDEKKHPRAADGEFGSGGANKPAKQTVSQKIGDDPRKAVAALDRATWHDLDPKEFDARVEVLGKAPAKLLLRKRKEALEAWSEAEAKYKFLAASLAEKEKTDDGGLGLVWPRKWAADAKAKMDDFAGMVDACEKALERGHGIDYDADTDKWVKKK